MDGVAQLTGYLTEVCTDENRDIPAVYMHVVHNEDSTGDTTTQISLSEQCQATCQLQVEHYIILSRVLSSFDSALLLYCKL